MKQNKQFNVFFVIIISVLLVWTTSMLFAQGGRWQIQYDKEASETLGLNGKNLQGSFATLPECESYRKSLSAYEQSHTKSVRSNTSETSQQELPQKPDAQISTPHPKSSAQTVNTHKIQKKVENSVGPEQATETPQIIEADVPEIVVQTGHLRQVNAVALTPDGRFAVSGGRDCMLKLWDTGTGKEIRTFKGNLEEINCIAISADGRFALVGNETSFNNLNLWDITTGKPVRTFSGFSDRISSIAISPDGQFVIASSGHQLKVWRTETGQEVQTLGTDSAEINSIAVSRDGRYIVSGGADKLIKVWDLASGKNIRTFSGSTDAVCSLAISTDGTFLISGCFNDSPRMWDMNTGNLLKTFDRGGVLSLAISPDGKSVIFGGEPDIEIWNISKGKKIETLKGGKPGWVRSLAYSQDGKSILSGGDDKYIKLWNAGSGKEIWSSEGQFQVASAAISSDGEKMIVGMTSGYLNIWDLSTGKQIQTIKQNLGVNCVAINGDGTKSFAGGCDFETRRTSVRQWETSSVKELTSFSQDGGAWVNSMAITSDGNDILWSVRGSLILSDMATGRKIRSFGSMDKIDISEICTRGKYALTSNRTNSSQLWDIETGEMIHSFEDFHAVLTQTGNKVLLMGQDAEDQLTLKFWDIDTKQEISSISGHYPMKIQVGQSVYRYRQINSLRISPDDRLALWSCDNELHLWNIAEAKEIYLFSGHAGRINSIGFSPNGKFAYSGSFDGSTRLWNVETGKEMLRFYSFNDGEWLTITPGGYFDASPKGSKYLAVRDGDNIYDISKVQAALQNPMITQAVLMGNEPPADQTVASVLAMNQALPAGYHLGLIEILLLLTLLWVVPFLIALIDILRHNFIGINKIVWVLILLAIPVIGPILYVAIGRKQKINT